ncbi:hypothetical protein GOARA_050_00490 [Gordonia araii NBRC 100433]|uniref:Integral membrane protein n=1 Tax=Gordonia araii NBRC 100433 TaxID=1073574 RepID=G7H2B2_9ACTN|nr:hypothetical protein [Gordonia araii]NNG97526.1 hypothetical protein [Gordonia araii NBRC 100433]GAB09987.1 hypothetical protein GOARA_050_00490 [Gordonia araii NBRC 100433]
MLIDHLDNVTIATIVAAGVLLAGAMVLGVWKYQQILASPDGQAHVYVDIAHRAALMYSFATLVLAALVALSAWPAWVNAASVAVAVFFFVAAIGSYILHGALRDTSNQFRPRPAAVVRAFMVALIIGEVGSVVVLVAGVIVAWGR